MGLSALAASLMILSLSSAHIYILHLSNVNGLTVDFFNFLSFLPWEYGDQSGNPLVP